MDENETFMRYYAIQKEIAKKVVRTDDLPSVINFIAGVDVAYDDNAKEMVGAIVILNSQTLEVVEKSFHKMEITFPYVPGLFSFREIPPIVEAFNKLKHKPDLIICDGHGIAHPKEAGMASHLGVELDIPTIGCAKKRLIGFYQKEELKSIRGSDVDLIWNSKIVGKVLRTQDNVNPVFVSIGHKISLEKSVEWVLRVTTKYRLPETTREVDQLVNSVLKNRIEIDPFDDLK
ncbi:MAG: deoxyribonuclease V [Saprospiraceae bacterium]|nr:deoxyribonuclease V [Saprospiraceae bacterium]